MRRRLSMALLGAALAIGLTVPAAFAATPDDACWGVVTYQLVSDGGGRSFGEHASGQSTPRLGLGNVARLFLGDDAKVYELGTLLASIDGSDATSCG